MKFIIDHIFLICVVVLSGGALLWPVLTTRGKRLTPQEVTLLINRGKATIVDVRDSAQFAEGHVRDAKNIPLPELVKRVGELEKSKNRTVILMCQKGNRASAAVGVLTRAGFADVVCLDGGLAEWQKQGLPLAKSAITLKKEA